MKPLSLTLLSLAVAALTANTAAHAQTFPEKSVRIVVPFAPGGPTDQLARGVANKLQTLWGKPVVVENKPGGGGQISAQILKQAPADGYTWFLGTTEMFAINKELYKNFSYDPKKDFKMVAGLMSTPMLLVVNEKVPAGSVKDFVDFAKASPKGLSFGSQGIGSLGHMLGQQFMNRTSTNLHHVPYKGSMPALQDIIGGQPEFMFDVEPSSAQFVKANKIKAVAIAAPERSNAFPNVPTLAESGLTGMDTSVWMAIAVRHDTPEAVVQAIHQGVSTAINDSEVTKNFTSNGWHPMTMDREALGKFVDSEIARWGAIAKSTGVTVE